MDRIRARLPRTGLWSHADFLRLWSAETISQFGSHVTALALPLVAIILLEASAFEVALLATVGMAPFILVSLPAGVWVDRLPRRPILVAADFGRAAALVSVPAAHAFDAVTLEQLYAVAFVFGVMTVFFDVAYQSYLPSLVDKDQLVEGNSKLEISRSGAQLAGPGLAGGLIELLTAPVAIVADAASFVASGLFILRIRKRETVPERPQRRSPFAGMRAELGEGLRYVLGHPHLRWIAATTATYNLFANGLFAILLVYAVRVLELTPGVIGLVFAIGNVGFLAAALTARRIGERLGIGRTLVLGTGISGPALLLIPLATPDLAIPLLVVSAMLGGFGVVLYNINQVSFRQAITPERLQGRMNAVMRFMVWGTIPIGQLAAGGLATAIGLRPTMAIAAAGGTLSALPVALSRVRTLRGLPEPEEPPPPAEAMLETTVPAPFPRPEEP